MPLVAVSALDVLLVVGLGAAGFLVVVLVCAGVLGMLQLILPSTDSGAEPVAGTDQARDTRGGDDPPAVDAEGNA